MTDTIVPGSAQDIARVRELLPGALEFVYAARERWGWKTGGAVTVLEAVEGICAALEAVDARLWAAATTTQQYDFESSKCVLLDAIDAKEIAIARLRSLLDKATPEPWARVRSTWLEPGDDSTNDIVAGRVSIAEGVPEADATLIAESRNALPDLLAALAAKDLEIALTEPTEPGAFVGDIYFGCAGNSTRGTHKWDGSGWAVLPSDVEVLTELLAHTRDALAARDVEIARLREAAKDVVAERERQVSAEGWTCDHDDQWRSGELATAAGAYALASTFYHADPYEAVLSVWPWSRGWLKPTTPRRDLVKAGALILAEIERLDRAALEDTP